MGINSEVLMMAQTLDHRYGRHYEWKLCNRNAPNTYNFVFTLCREIALKIALGAEALNAEFSKILLPVLRDCVAKFRVRLGTLQRDSVVGFSS